jgi:hypothetical protein
MWRAWSRRRTECKRKHRITSGTLLAEPRLSERCGEEALLHLASRRVLRHMHAASMQRACLPACHMRMHICRGPEAYGRSAGAPVDKAQLIQSMLQRPRLSFRDIVQRVRVQRQRVSVACVRQQVRVPSVQCAPHPVTPSLLPHRMPR